MSKIVLAFRGYTINAAMDETTNGFLDYVVQDHPENSERHAELIGLLAHTELVISNDEGALKVEIREQKEVK